jgi:hypothetical protein
MGRVRTNEFHRVAGVHEPVESVVDYTYCDQCGSFNINQVIKEKPPNGLMGGAS